MGKLNVYRRMKRLSLVKIQKGNKSRCLREWILWDEVVLSWSKSKRMHSWRSGGTSSASDTDQIPAPAHSGSAISALLFQQSQAPVGLGAPKSCEHAQKPKIGSGNKTGPITFLSTSDHQRRKHSPPRGTHLMTSYHCHRQNPTGRSSGTVLPSCCLYYCLQSRSLLPGHQPLCLHGQPERKQKWHRLPCAYFQPRPLSEFTSQGAFICLEKII